MAKKQVAPVNEDTFTPTEEQILAQIRQNQVRAAYQTKPETIAKRKAYNVTRYAQQAALRAAVKNLKDTDPEKYEQMMKQAASLK